MVVARSCLLFSPSPCLLFSLPRPFLPSADVVGWRVTAGIGVGRGRHGLRGEGAGRRWELDQLLDLGGVILKPLKPAIYSLSSSISSATDNTDSVLLLFE